MARWTKRLLGDVVRLEYGKPLPEDLRSPSGPYLAYGANGVLCRAKEYYCDFGSIIIGRKGSAGEVNLTDGNFWPTDVTYYVTFDTSSHSLKFLFYLFKLLDLPKLAKGVKPGINRNEVYALSVAIPRLEEQKRIVAILDEAFEGLDRAAANAKKNLANARELFDSHLNAVFAQQGPDWKANTTLSTILAAQPRNGWSPPAEYQTGSGNPVLTLSAVTGFEYDGSRVKLTSVPVKENAHYWLEPGELLITRSNTPALVGHVAIYDGNPQRAICPDLIMKMKVDPEKADTRFVYLFLRSAQARAYFMSRAHGASSTMKKISKEMVQNVQVPLPSLPKQRAAASQLDRINEETKNLEGIYKVRLQRLCELRQSILQKAFAGELTERLDLAA